MMARLIEKTRYQDSGRPLDQITNTEVATLLQGYIGE
jgi:hypothetical protein